MHFVFRRIGLKALGSDVHHRTHRLAHPHRAHVVTHPAVARRVQKHKRVAKPLMVELSMIVGVCAVYCW